MPSLSPRLLAVVDALPLRPGLRVLEIGCGPGAAAREVAARVGPTGHVLAVDRSPRAIEQVATGGADLVASGRLSMRTTEAQHLVLGSGEAPYDLAFAVRVGALDGRHPAQQDESVRRIWAILTPAGRFFLDGGDPLRELTRPRTG